MSQRQRIRDLEQELAIAHRWILAKCTISDCWKSKYEQEVVKLAALKVLVARSSIRPTIVCLCGSTRFMDTLEKINWEKTLAGEIVLSVGISEHLLRPKEEVLGNSVALALDELHKRKIDLADYILVLNVGGYIGASTKSEIEYAEALGKRVDYLDGVK